MNNFNNTMLIYVFAFACDIGAGALDDGTCCCGALAYDLP